MSVEKESAPIEVTDGQMHRRIQCTDGSRGRRERWMDRWVHRPEQVPRSRAKKGVAQKGVDMGAETGVDTGVEAGAERWAAETGGTAPTLLWAWGKNGLGIGYRGV